MIRQERRSKHSKNLAKRLFKKKRTLILKKQEEILSERKIQKKRK